MPLFSSSVAGSIAFAAALAAGTPVAHQVSLEEWAPAVGDHFVVDTLSNEGYLVHTDGEYVEFPVVTGQHRYVYYIGRSYNAATPNWDWLANSKEIKGDHVTFGPSGRFIRLYKDGERTAYGIHEYKYEDEMFSRESRYGSMGCVIVKASMMNIIEQTYDINAETGVPVFTRHGVEDAVQVAFPTPTQTVANN